MVRKSCGTLCTTCAAAPAERATTASRTSGGRTRDMVCSGPRADAARQRVTLANRVRGTNRASGEDGAERVGVIHEVQAFADDVVEVEALVAVGLVQAQRVALALGQHEAVVL